MLIKNRTVVVCEVLTIEDFESFIVDSKLYKFFVKFNATDRPKIYDLIKTTETIGVKKIKPTLKKILNYPNTLYNKDFLLSMGWDIEDIIGFISDKQKKNSEILTNKKKSNPEKYSKSYSTKIEYWLNKGYTEEVAKEKLSNRQNTFSLAKCIEKYGQELGIKKFNERQERWVSTLKTKENYVETQKSKNVFKYGRTEKELLFKFAKFSEKTMGILTKCYTNRLVNEFVDCIIEHDDIKRYSDLLPYINSSVIQNTYNVTNTEIKNIFYGKLDLTKTRQYYGIPIYHNGVRYKSVGEYRIAIFLESEQINFIYEKQYPNSNFKSDFYLVDKNVYVEYYGLLNKKNLNKLDPILSAYYEKTKLKNQFCVDNELKLIYDFDYKQLINKIKKHYEN
jgi:hypothetical protein